MRIPWYIRTEKEKRNSTEPLRDGEPVIRRDSFSDNPKSTPYFSELEEEGGQIFNQHGQPVWRFLPRLR